MIKLRAAVVLTANVPQRVAPAPLGGVDFYDDLIKIQFNPNLAGNIIYISFITASGASFSHPVTLDNTGYISFMLNSSLENMLVEHNFDFVEILSSADMLLEIIIEKQEGGFINF
jgi:hypothetical protein